MAKPRSLNLEIEKPPVQTPQKPVPSPSTIHPDRLEHSRFSDRVAEEEGSSSLKILIYVLIVIIVGVGAALLIRSFIVNNESDTATDNDTQDEEDTEVESAFVINKTTAPDATAKLPTSLTSYNSSAQVTLGEDLPAGTVTSLDKILYNKYTTFSRVEFDFSGAKLPKVNAQFDSVKNIFTVKLPEGVTVATELQSTKQIDDLVTEIKFDSAAKQYTLTLSKDSVYAVKQDAGNLIVDFKTEDQLQADQNIEDEPLVIPEPQPQVPPSSSNDDEDDAPTGDNFENDFSQKQQYVTSDMTGTPMAYNKFYYGDTGTYLELSWGQQGKLGEDFIPNATAYLKTETGKEYLYVEIENISTEPFSQLGFANNGSDLSTYMNTSGSNFVRIDRTKFEGGKATYRIELKRKSDFALLSQETFDGTTQVISIQIKD